MVEHSLGQSFRAMPAMDGCSHSKRAPESDVTICLQVRALRTGRSNGPAGQPLGSGNSSSLGTGSYGAGVHTLGLNADANGLLNAIINRLPPGSLSGEALRGAFSHACASRGLPAATAPHNTLTWQ